MKLRPTLGLENVLDLMEELSEIALKCPTCRDLFREVILLYKNSSKRNEDHNILKKYGSPSLAMTNLPISNESGSFDTGYRRKSSRII